MGIIGILCFMLMGVPIVGLGWFFIFRRDYLWARSQNIDGMLPEDYDRDAKWDWQMIGIGITFLISGLLCIGLGMIGVFFSP